MKKMLLSLVITLVLFSMTVVNAETYVQIDSWGSEGSGNGEFYSPNGVAVDTRGNVYVADSRNHRIQKFDSDGSLLGEPWGNRGSGLGQFEYPEGVAVDTRGNVYVADSWNRRIQKFDSDGNFLTILGGDGSGTGQPYAVAVGPRGNVYVADSSNHRIQKFDSDGSLLGKPWGGPGSGVGLFKWPEGVAVDTRGYVYVSDLNNHRIQKFRPNGTCERVWGSEGTGDGQFKHPRGIAVDVDTDGSVYVYVADTVNHRIQKFDSDGNFVTAWGGEGSGFGQFKSPKGVAVDSAGNVYVADSLNDRILKFERRETFGEGGEWEKGRPIHERIMHPGLTTTTTTTTRGIMTPSTIQTIPYQKPYRKF